MIARAQPHALHGGASVAWHRTQGSFSGVASEELTSIQITHASDSGNLPIPPTGFVNVLVKASLPDIGTLSFPTCSTPETRDCITVNVNRPRAVSGSPHPISCRPQ